MSSSEIQSHVQCMGDQMKMIQAISCIVDSKRAIYISGPITTGKNFIDWYLLSGVELGINKTLYESRLRAEVIKKNEASILELAKKVRQETNAQVIEPASLFVPEWGQLEYINFWIKIIDSFVSEIILAKGWQYSIGCVTEYSFASEKGLVIRSYDGEVLSSQKAQELLKNAASEVEKLAENDLILKALASGLRKAAMEK